MPPFSLPPSLSHEEGKNVSPYACDVWKIEAGDFELP